MHQVGLLTRLNGVRIWIIIGHFVRTEVWGKGVVNQWKKNIARSLAVICRYICHMTDKLSSEWRITWKLPVHSVWNFKIKLSPALLRSFACAHYSIKRPKLTSSGIQTALRVKLERHKKVYVSLKQRTFWKTREKTEVEILSFSFRSVMKGYKVRIWRTKT